MTARPPAAERLVDAYLHDLERALSHLEVDERRDVVDSVREHIDAALEERGGTPTTDDVHDVLQQLGAVERIAHDPDGGSPTPPDQGRDQDGGDQRRPAAAAQYLLAALIVGMSITAVLVIVRVPSFFGPEGGDPLVVGQLAWVFVVLAVAAGIVKRNNDVPR
jgi:uncharacterized membrane protein